MLKKKHVALPPTIKKQPLPIFGQSKAMPAGGDHAMGSKRESILSLLTKVDPVDNKTKI